MMEVPPHAPCPDCGQNIALDPSGPHGVAWHECGGPDESRDVFTLIARNAADPAANQDALAKEVMRAALASSIRTGEMNAQSAGALLAGHAQVKQAGGDSTLADLLGFHEDDEDEEALG